MSRRNKLVVWGSLSLGVLAGSDAMAQAPAPAAPATLWSFLGIPQAIKGAQDNVLNRTGNRPGIEKKPPLKPIADPANLESPNPPIKKAAEIKQAEDLKKQKIKAVKYLTTIGCGCYNKDGGITDAIKAALDDCTEEVRLATVQSIGEAAATGSCSNCNERCCCNKEITKKLSDIAYERNDEGCFLEPSERVRKAAVESLCACCPGCAGQPQVEYAPAPIEEIQPEVTPERKGEGPLVPEAAPQPQPVDPQALKMPMQKHAAPIVKPGPVASTPALKPAPTVAKPAVKASPVSASSSSRRNGGPVRAVLTDGDSGELRSTMFVSEETHRLTDEPARPATATSATAVSGSIKEIDRTKGTVEIGFDKNAKLPVGRKVEVYHNFVLTGESLVGNLEVIRSEAGVAVAKPVDGVNLLKIAKGDKIKVTNR